MGALILDVAMRVLKTLVDLFLLFAPLFLAIDYIRRWFLHHKIAKYGTSYSSRVTGSKRNGRAIYLIMTYCIEGTEYEACTLDVIGDIARDAIRKKDNVVQIKIHPDHPGKTIIEGRRYVYYYVIYIVITTGMLVLFWSTLDSMVPDLWELWSRPLMWG